MIVWCNKYVASDWLIEKIRHLIGINIKIKVEICMRRRKITEINSNSNLRGRAFILH